MTIATFGAYLLGYLSVRFQLTALGLGTDLELLDERYLFEGAKFLVYLVATIPLVVFVAIPLAAGGWVAMRYWPRLRILAAQAQSRPMLLLTIGTVMSVVIIQLVMRKCFAFDNLLLRDSLPDPEWFRHLLVSSSDLLMQLYFAALLIGIAVGAGPLLAYESWKGLAPVARATLSIWLFLLGIQVLLLPVNYGVLQSGRAMPRLAPNSEPISDTPGATAWLIWEGKQASTFLVREPSSTRKLLTLPREKVPRTEIVAYDALQVLRARPEEPSVATWTWKGLADLFVGPSPRAQRNRSAPRGDIFMVPSQGGMAEQLTRGGGFHSPLFLPGDDALVALHGATLVRIDLKGGEPREIGTLQGSSRLIGVDPNNPNAIIFLAEMEDRPRGMRFDLQSKRSTVVTPIATDESILAYLRGDDRERENFRIAVKEKDPDAWWADVFLQRSSEPEVNLTRGQGVSSRQPTLSNDGRYVAFVRTGGPT